MEKGKLIVRKTKSGFEVLLEYEKGGQIKTMSLSFVRLKNDMHNGKDCRYRRNQGQIEHLELLDGTIIYTQKPVPAANAQNQSAGTDPSTAQVPDIFNLAHACVPKDVRNLQIGDIDNFHLKLNRFAYLKQENNQEPLPWGDKRKKFILCETKPQKGFTHKIKPNYGDFHSPNRLVQVIERQYRAALSLCRGANNLFSMDVMLKDKMALGLGNESIYETSMTLHHVYGFPYIPASAVKGLLRSYYIREKCHNKEDEAVKDPFFCQIFGCPDKTNKNKTESYFKEALEGKAVFFDALPITPPKVEPDIMNPHYSEYYTGEKEGKGKWPTDTGNPVPIHFLVVQATTFRFAGGIKPSRFSKEERKEALDRKIMDFIAEALPIALQEHGLGAKTAIGYGYFKP